jgi:hypothetical protein
MEVEMELQLTPTYITTVNADHTVVLPVDVPVGAHVAIVLIPSAADEVARQARFATTLAAIKEAAQATHYETSKDLDSLMDDLVRLLDQSKV